MYNFIANEKSGKGIGKRNIRKIMRYCDKNNIHYIMHVTNSIGHASRIVKGIVENGGDKIIAIGGDGTFHEVLNGIPDFSNVTLGFIPSGRGNDYARSANLSLNPIKAFEDIIRGEVAYTDYIQVGKHRCLNVCGTGLDIEVLEKTDSSAGKISYLLGLVKMLRNFDPYQVEVTINGVTTSHTCVMVGVCNGGYFGGGINVSPLSDTSDGKLNVIIMEMPEKTSIFKILPKFQKGLHLDLPITKHVVANSVSVTGVGGALLPIELDGEIYLDVPFNAEIVTGKLKTFKINSKEKTK